MLTTFVLHIVLVEIIYKCHAKLIITDKIQNYNDSMTFLSKNFSDLTGAVTVPHLPVHKP